MHSFRNDAVKRGTQRPLYGIAVYYKPHLIQQLPTIANMNGVEKLVCPIKRGCDKRGCDNIIKVMAVYKLIIMGYFNVDIYGISSDYKQLKQFMSDMGLKQHIEEMTADMRTAIDHIYSNVESIMCGVSETYYSFHKFIWVALMWIVKGSTLWVLLTQRIALWKALLWIVKVNTARVLWAQRSASQKASLWIVKVDIAWVQWALRNASRKVSLWIVKVDIAWVLWAQRSASRKASLWIVKVDIAWVLWAQRSASRKASLWTVKVDIAWVLWVQRSALRKASLWIVKVDIAWVLWAHRSASRKASLNCQGWYSMGSMGSEECITECITVNCQGWYSMGPMGSEDCITEGCGMRVCPVSWLVEEEYCGGAIFVGTARVIWPQRCANGDCCQFWEEGERNKRIASRKVMESGCHVASLLAGGREALLGAILAGQWRLLPGGMHHVRLWNVDVTSLMGEKYCGGAIFVGWWIDVQTGIMTSASSPCPHTKSPRQ